MRHRGGKLLCTFLDSGHKAFVGCTGTTTEQSSMLAVQEVQSNHFVDFLQPELLKHGYSAVYKKKTMEIYTGNSYAIDGCATFFKKEKFGLVKKYEVSSEE